MWRRTWKRQRRPSYDLYAAKLTLEDADEEYKDKAGDLGYNKDNYEYIAVKHQWAAAQYTYNAADAELRAELSLAL